MQLSDSIHFTVKLWMVDKLKLRTTERDVFAIIYGFSQDGQSDYHGSLSYMATLTGYSRNSICTALKNLTEKNLIIKDEKTENNIKYCSYRANIKSVQTACTGVQTACTGVQTALTNNNINNKDNNSVFISKDINTSNPGKSSTSNSFIGSAKSKNKKSPNLYESCINLIDNFIITNHCEEIRHILIQHLDIAMEQKRIRGRTQYKGILDKLATIKNNSGVSYEDIIMYSIEHGYPTFYTVTKNNSNKRINETGKRHVESFTEEDQKRLDEFKEKCRREGKQVEF